MVQIVQSSISTQTRKPISGEAILHWALADEFILRANGLLAEEAACDGMHLKNRAATGMAIEVMALGCRVDSSRGCGGRVPDDALAVLDALMGMDDAARRLLIRYGSTGLRPLDRLPGVLQLIDTGGRQYDRNRNVVACWLQLVGPTPDDQAAQAAHHLAWRAALTEMTRRLSIERKLVKHKLVSVFSSRGIDKTKLP